MVSFWFLLSMWLVSFPFLSGWHPFPFVSGWHLVMRWKWLCNEWKPITWGEKNFDIQFNNWWWNCNIGEQPGNQAKPYDSQPLENLYPSSWAIRYILRFKTGEVKQQNTWECKIMVRLPARCAQLFLVEISEGHRKTPIDLNWVEIWLFLTYWLHQTVPEFILLLIVLFDD